MLINRATCTDYLYGHDKLQLTVDVYSTAVPLLLSVVSVFHPSF